MSPTLFYNALFVSYAVHFFSGVGALPNPAVTVYKAASSSSPSTSAAAAAASTVQTIVASTPSTTSASASTSTSATSSSSAPVSTSTNISPLGSATDVFTQGQACKASWTPASSSSTTWKNMTIDLMTGSNLQMTKLATVASGLDGTSSTSTFEYSCPDVSPNAPIYFLQYTHDDGLDPMWTTRFTIANDAGIWMPPTEANQPEGGSPAIPWGQGELVVTQSSASSQLSVSKDSSLASFQAPALSAVAVAVVVACLL